MDIRAHAADMASALPMSSSTHSFMQSHGAHVLPQQQQQQQHVAELATAGTGANSAPTISKVKIITTSSNNAGSATGSGAAGAGTARAAAGRGNNGIAETTHVVINTTSGTSNVLSTSAGNGMPIVVSASGAPGSTTAVASANIPHHDHELKLPFSFELKGKKPVRYRECLKNHAANIGGHANDGCGEFMPSGEEGTLEALRCAACSCHRNFHRREVEGEEPASSSCDCRYGAASRKRLMEPLFPSPAGSHLPLPLPPPAGLHLHHPTPIGSVRPPHLQPSQMIMAFNSHDPDDYDGALLSPHSSMKKRFRTKFTSEQKDQMYVFAEKIGWRIQKQDEEAVQQFCAEVGVKRHVLKVWMHNNKSTFGKKSTMQASGCMSTSMGSEDEMRS